MVTIHSQLYVKLIIWKSKQNITQNNFIILEISNIILNQLIIEVMNVSEVLSIDND